MLPPAIIFINSDAVDGYVYDGYSDGYIPVPSEVITRNNLINQLYINEYMSGAEFDARVLVDPNYPQIVHLQGLRILVARDNLRDYTNRDLADIVLFYSHGNVSVLKNNNGPPGLTLPIDRINIYTLLRDVGSKYVVILPASATKPPTSLGGIVVDQLADSSGVYDSNPDSEKNNIDFINRK
jgi:hypothetical protein